MFDRSARFYDLIYASKDYAAEAAKLVEMIKVRAPSARTLLDVACGSGQHLRHLRAHFEVEGSDIEPGLLELAAANNPGLTFHQADMVELALGRSFDVITCLFSSIGYVKTVERLEKTIAAFTRHLAPGGLLVVEPWLFPERFEHTRVILGTHDAPELKVARVMRSQRDGDLITLDTHYLIGTPTRIEHAVEQHQLFMFSQEQYRTAFAAQGLQVELDDHGLDGRGLFIARAR
jgi:SAM-dependent methyltransferase